MTYEMLFTLQYGIDVDSFIASNEVTTSTSSTTGPPAGGGSSSSAVPLPPAAWSGLAALAALGLLKTLRAKSPAI